MLHHNSLNAPPPPEVLPPDLDLTPVSRRPCQLSDETARKAISLQPPPDPCLVSAPRASVIVVMYNQLPFTRLCLHSLLTEADRAKYKLDVIVVDNCSTDDTPDYLRRLHDVRPDVHPIFNEVNRGFAAATNQGLAAARCDLLVLLNNDTLLPPGWLERMERHASDAATGLVGPVTNRTCNEAQVETDYTTWGGFVDAAQRRAMQMHGCSFDIPMTAMFCVAMRREVHARLGSLDEQFGIGMFEDDDYSARAHAAGLRVVCGEDVLVHHFGEASFGGLVSDGRYATLLDENRRRYEQKWGVTWTPHRRRASSSYEALVERLRTIVNREVPSGSTLFVVSRGDGRLLSFEKQRAAAHFPQIVGGGYAHAHPADDAAAIALLSCCRDSFLVFPATAFWWLTTYPRFARHLEASSERFWQDETCRIYRLR